MVARRNSFNLGLPATPEISERQQFQEFIRVYNAINILADFLDSYTNSGGVATGSFTNVTVAQLLDLSGAAAGRIKFPATQVPSADVNTLDDYEEGTFTPTIAFGGASVGVTYAAQAGFYTKIGNRVEYSLVIVLTSKGSSVGSMTVGGLPFPVSAIANTASPAAVVYGSIVTTGMVTAFALEATSTFRVFQTTPAGVISDIADTAATNTTLIRLSGNYRV